jgi:hypothetical protein
MKYYVLIQPWAIYVKEGKFFEEQQGLKEDWGKAWTPVDATSIEHARTIGELMRERGEG